MIMMKSKRAGDTHSTAQSKYNWTLWRIKILRSRAHKRHMESGQRHQQKKRLIVSIRFNVYGRQCCHKVPGSGRRTLIVVVVGAFHLCQIAARSSLFAYLYYTLNSRRIVFEWRIKSQIYDSIKLLHRVCNLYRYFFYFLLFPTSADIPLARASLELTLTAPVGFNSINAQFNSICVSPTTLLHISALVALYLFGKFNFFAVCFWHFARARQSITRTQSKD